MLRPSYSGGDVIVYAGDAIAASEVEQVLYRYPAVRQAAVVARPDPRWGEVPCAFIALKSGMETTTAEDIIGFCRERMARFKVPKTIIFMDLPKTPGGKIDRSALRQRARAL